MKKKNAFTLIELLVVVSIIALLVAMLFPAIGKLMEKGRAKQDANNLRNIGQGIRIYLNDHDDSFFELGATGDEAWPKVLKSKYVPDWKSFRSPFDKPTTSRPNKDEDPVPVSYGLSVEMLSAKSSFTGKWTAPPSTLIMAAPAVSTGENAKGVTFKADAVSTNNVTIQPGNAGGLFGTHEERYAINVLFFDGHVDQMDWKKFADNTSTTGIERWYPMER